MKPDRWAGARPQQAFQKASVLYKEPLKSLKQWNGVVRLAFPKISLLLCEKWVWGGVRGARLEVGLYCDQEERGKLDGAVTEGIRRRRGT